MTSKTNQTCFLAKLILLCYEGTGWRLAVGREGRLFSALIGGETWAFEITESEWRELAILVLALESQHTELQDQLMLEEAIELEMERGVWWGCMDGDRRHWNLKLILNGEASAQRSMEAHWPSPAAAAIVAAMRTAWDLGNYQTH